MGADELKIIQTAQCIETRVYSHTGASVRLYIGIVVPNMLTLTILKIYCVHHCSLVC